MTLQDIRFAAALLQANILTWPAQGLLLEAELLEDVQFNDDAVRQSCKLQGAAQGIKPGPSYH